MTPDSPQMFGVALMVLWGTAGAVALGRAAAKSPATRELLAAARKMNLAAKGAIVAGLVCAVAIGGTKPGGTNDPPRGLRSPSPTIVVEPSVAPVEVRTNAVALRAESVSAVEVPDWRKHGSSTGGVWLDFDEPFFKIGTNPVSRAYVTANGSISFESTRRPPVGAPLPDGTGLPALVPLLAPLGMVPEANWTNSGAASRFWHDEAPGRGRVFTWENALLDRLPGRRVSVQAELRPSGDFTYRYDFHDGLEPPATNFVLGAQVGTNGVNALAFLGKNLLAETVWRVDDARVTNGLSIADLLYTNGILRAPARFAIEWKNTSGLDPNADSDGDGLFDWDEIFRYGTDPNRSDTDGDGLSDGSEILAGLSPSAYDMDDDGLVDGIDPHPLVSDGNGFGTSELWVQCSFTNAVEILAEGYEAYIARITGDTLPNPVPSRGGNRSESSPHRKLYILSVSVSGMPDGRRVLVGVGDKRIVLASGGTSVFALEKGREYELVTDAPDLVSFGCEHPDPVVVAPTWSSSGRVFWLASGIEVDPPTWHFPAPGASRAFSASCLDCHPDHATGWSWTSESPDLVFDTPHASSCMVRWTGSPVPWGSADFTVSCVNLGETFSKVVRVTFGEHATPQTTLSVLVPEAFFVNDDDDDGDGTPDWDDNSVAVEDDIVPLSFSIVQDDPVSGTMTIEVPSGVSQFRAWIDSSKTAPLSWPVQLDVAAAGSQAVTIYVEAGSPSGYVNGSRFRATFESDDGNTLRTQEATLTVVRLPGIEVPSAPATGLAVLRGTQVGMQLNVSPLGAASLLSSDWRLARRKSDGGYRDWTTAASSVSGRFWSCGFPTPGIYRIAADVSLPGGAGRTVHYLRNGLGPYDDDSIEEWNHIGVSATQGQLDLREFAVSQLGGTDFAYSAHLPSINGFSAVRANDWKCNAFAAYCAISVGQAVPVQHGHPPLSSYPPVANDWATGEPIVGWTFLGIGPDPEPGWICGHPQPGASGHVGIVDYDGWGVAAGKENINRKYTRFLDGTCGYNKYGE